MLNITEISTAKKGLEIIRCSNEIYKSAYTHMQQ